VLSSPQARRLAREAIDRVLSAVSSRRDSSSVLGAISNLHQELVDAISTDELNFNLAGTRVAGRSEQDSAPSPTTSEMTISAAGTTTRDVDLKRAWTILVTCYIAIAVVQHIASYLQAVDPAFDIEKFIDHHVNALGGACAVLGTWALMKKLS
ncbi:hypothetical protein AB0F72_20865, partial [Actinoplanes sp. NPDC023936]|uniref:hypothetical protein n=1 Tax=Actinoplanes sp. NPDC023936 TaxID=3154910 RepID=UPI0033C365AB